PNRTVKRLCADDSEHSFVKVGHRQALIPQNPSSIRCEGFCLCAAKNNSFVPPLQYLREAQQYLPDADGSVQDQVEFCR
ncbi:hypothetical protein, partial [Bordetella genomosp. 4]|uniref:hypothetical protein n=1 Tax=Bordetella genomosp. 4 TaxID=463044 RepID=UPI001C3E3818